MRKLVLFLGVLIFSLNAICQSPEKFSYQAVVRNSENELISNSELGVRVNIIQGSPEGSSVFEEKHSPITNANGLFSIEIGTGSTISGNLSEINWSNAPFFIKTEIDPSGGTDYTITGTSQLLSVPYALHAKTAESLTGTIAETDPVFSSSAASGISSADTSNWNNKSDFSGEYDDLTNKPINISEFNNDAGYIISPDDSDSDAKNEIQYLSVSALGDTLYLSEGNWVIIPGISDANSENGNESTVTDIDGNVYQIVTIGEQVWMAESLKVINYNDGTPIPLVSNATEWRNLSSAAYCWYDNDSIAYANPYGALYNWYTVDRLSNGDKNVCPTDWHVPTDGEWDELSFFLGGDTVAGGKLKQAGTSYWQSPNTGATNETEFTALPGGWRYSGDFQYMKESIYFWGSTEYTHDFAWSRSMHYYASVLNKNNSHKKFGIYIRCIKD